MDANRHFEAVPLAEAPARAELLRLFVDRAEDFAFLLLDTTGAVVGINEGASRLYGYPEVELRDTSVARLYPAEEARDDKLRQDLAQAAESGRLAEEGVRVRRDGSEFYASTVITALRNDTGELRGFSLIAWDITAARNNETSLRRMVELSLNAIVLVNHRGEIVSVNTQTEKLFGYTRDQLIGQAVEILVPDRYKRDHPKNRDGFFNAPVVRPMGAGRDLYGRRSDGSEFPVEIGLSPIDTLEGPAVLGSIVDITERKMAEERARRHLADLAHVARLSTVGQMFSELAHEINQPLASAANYARACVSFARSGSGASQEELIGWMEKSAAQTGRAIDIVNRLGSFVKKDSGVRALTNINRLIERVTTLTAPTMQTKSDAPETIRFELQLDEAIPEIDADSLQIEQVLLNLVRNAVEAMQESTGQPRKLTLRTSHDDIHVRVEVSDTGPGIDAEHFARLFEPYFTTKTAGIGLGLSISRSIVENHEGRLEAETSERGTTFRFVLPMRKRGQER